MVLSKRVQDVCCGASALHTFFGSSQASLIGAILKDEPPPISPVEPMSPGRPVLAISSIRVVRTLPDLESRSALHCHKYPYLVAPRSPAPPG